LAANQQIQQCIQQCQQISQQLSTMSTAETNPQVKMKLEEAAHHLKLCIEECNFTVQHAGMMAQ